MANANQSYITGSVSVLTTAATKICTVPAENDSVWIQNTGSNAVYLGGPSVTSSTGFKVAASAIQEVPSTGSEVHDLYAIAVTATTTVSYLYPEV